MYRLKNEQKVKYPKILLLRYANNKGIDTILEHMDIAENEEFCWWAKLGKKPGVKYLERFFEEGDGTAFLYKPGSIHRCKIIGVSETQPIDHYPKYYERDLFSDRTNLPKVYFKLTNITEFDLEELERYVVVNSGKTLMHDLKTSISSFILIQDRAGWIAPKKKEKKTKLEKKDNIDPKFCIYKTGGICKNKRCINYSYECERPMMCAKKKSK